MSKIKQREAMKELAIMSTPAKVFHADKPMVDGRRLRRHLRSTFIGVDPAKPGCDRTAYTRCTSKESFDEQYMQKPNVENSEESHPKDLHEKSGFDLPYNCNCSLQSLRASYNYKAKKAGIETYKWTNK